MPRILVGSYHTSDQAGVYLIDMTPDGAHTVVAALRGITNPSFMARQGNMIYTVSETNSGAGQPGGVVAIRHHQGTLSHGTRRPSGGDWPCHICISADKNFVIVSNYGSGNVGLLRIGTMGDIAGLNDVHQHAGTGPNHARQEGPHAHSTVVSPDGEYIIAADLGTDELVVYRINTNHTNLTRVNTVSVPAGNGPRHSIFHPNGKFLYVANELACSVSVFAYHDGDLSHVADYSTIAHTNDGFTVADIHISPDYKHLYVSTRSDDTIAAYAIQADGTLHRVGVYSCGGKWPRNFAISPDGTFVVVACQHDNHLAILPRDATSGALGARQATIPVHAASFVEFWS